MQAIEIGSKAVINETMVVGIVQKVDHYNVVLLDEDGNQHVVSRHGVTPQSFLTEGN